MWVNQETPARRRFQGGERPYTVSPVTWLPSEERQVWCPVVQVKASLLPRRHLPVATVHCNAFVSVVNVTDNISFSLGFSARRVAFVLLVGVGHILGSRLFLLCTATSGCCGCR